MSDDSIGVFGVERRKPDENESRAAKRVRCQQGSHKVMFKWGAGMSVATGAAHLGLSQVAKGYRGLNWRVKLIVGTLVCLGVPVWKGEEFLVRCNHEKYYEIGQEWRKY
eukprot:TRINITY_DN103471_c0_g1_i1.p1 TRINITY_DN103471_c0_g1~~TRINITY_DN103471_c0_g1_i1.p1  ORF type:complete len:109 (-),score=39.50 TRINITY_DN103471_c0_g1_i1:61-387(-)